MKSKTAARLADVLGLELSGNLDETEQLEVIMAIAVEVIKLQRKELAGKTVLDMTPVPYQLN